MVTNKMKQKTKMKNGIMAIALMALMFSGTFVVLAEELVTQVEEGSIETMVIDASEEESMIQDENEVEFKYYNLPYISGTGYAKQELRHTSEDDAVYEGKFINLHLLKNEQNLKGKIAIDGRNYLVDGIIADGKVEFNFFIPGSQGKADSIAYEGEFEGKVVKYDLFSILEGTLLIKNGEYEMVVISPHKVGILKENQPKVMKTRVKEVVRFRKEKTDGSLEVETRELDEDLTITPVEIRREKFLKIFPKPWGKKIVKVEIEKDGETITKTIRARSHKKFDNYKINVGSLEDEENIEITVEEVE